MSLHKQIAFGALVLAIVGLTLYVLRAGTPDSSTVPEPPLPPEVDTEPSAVSSDQQRTPTTGRGSLYALLAMGTPLQCTLTSTSEPGQTIRGTAHLANGKVHGEYDIDLGNMSYTMFTIFDGEYAYSWGETPVGLFANKVRVDQSSLGQGAMGQSASPDVTQDIDYECVPWVEDVSLFVPPAGIEFTDATAQIEATRANASTSAVTPQKGPDPCATCEQLTSPEMRAQCQSALACE